MISCSATSLEDAEKIVQKSPTSERRSTVRTLPLFWAGLFLTHVLEQKILRSASSPLGAMLFAAVKLDPTKTNSQEKSADSALFAD